MSAITICKLVGSGNMYFRIATRSMASCGQQSSPTDVPLITVPSVIAGSLYYIHFSTRHPLASVMPSLYLAGTGSLQRAHNSLQARRSLLVLVPCRAMFLTHGVGQYNMVMARMSFELTRGSS